jgi:hypothetical protein
LSPDLVPVVLRWRQVDRDGKIDIRAGGSAQYEFASLDKVKAGDNECLVSVIIEPTGSYISPGTLQDLESCRKQRRLQPPKCTGKQLWAKAIEKGVPESQQLATLAHNTRAGWLFSTPDGFQADLDDDCP